MNESLSSQGTFSNEAIRAGSDLKVAIFVLTPAQVHFYRNIYKELTASGARVQMVARDYGETVQLLDGLGIPYFPFSAARGSNWDKMVSIPGDVYRASKWLRKFNLDLIMGFGAYDVYASKILGVPNLIFQDSEPTIDAKYYSLYFKFFMPFVNNLITPSYFRKDYGERHLRVDSLKEMAYLHPSYYSPDDSIFDLLGVSKDESYSLLRFNAFDAMHDTGKGGFSDDDKRTLVHSLEKHSRVFISSETGIPEDLRPYVLKIPKTRIHDALFYAKILVTDTQTMATESAILGTPTVRCNSFVGPRDMGNFIELERQYGLLFSFADSKMAMQKADELIKDEGAKAEWKKKRLSFLEEKVDITAMMVWIVNHYPESIEQLSMHPEIQSKFTFKR